MKSSFKTVITSLPVSVLFFLIVLCISSCGVKTYPLALVSRVDTSGNQTPPHYVTNVTMPAGTQFVFVLAKDASGKAGGHKILFSGILTQEIPAGTEFAINAVSKQ